MIGGAEEFAKRPSLAWMKRSTARMWFVSALGKGGGQVIQLCAVMVLARVMVPEDFGLVAMAMVFVGVAEIFRDFGLSAATVRAQKMDPGRASAMFLTNVALGVVMTAGALAIAPFVTVVYSDERVVPVIQVLAWTFLINGLGAQHQALLRRQLKFGVLAWINLAVVVSSQLLAIVLALHGYGYWALVAAAISASFIRLVFVLAVNPWMPIKPVFDRNTRNMIIFGGYLALFGFIGFIANNLHNLIIGERYGAAEVGFYNRAFVLLSLVLGYVMAPLASVVPAALSGLLDDAEEYKSMYLHYIAMMMCMAAPLGFLVALSAEDIINVVLGDQWTSSILILQLLALSVIPRTLASSSGWLYQSHGDSRSMMYWGMGGWLFLLIMLVVGAQFGITGVAAAYSSGMFLLLYPCMFFAFRRTDMRFPDLGRVVLPFVGAALFSLVPVVPLWLYLADYQPLLRLMLIACSYGGIYVWLLVSVFKQRALVGELFRQLIPAKKGLAVEKEAVGTSDGQPY